MKTPFSIVMWPLFLISLFTTNASSFDPPCAELHANRHAKKNGTSVGVQLGEERDQAGPGIHAHDRTK